MPGLASADQGEGTLALVAGGTSMYRHTYWRGIRVYTRDDRGDWANNAGATW
jgi:hypothetical protein